MNHEQDLMSKERDRGNEISPGAQEDFHPRLLSVVPLDLAELLEQIESIDNED